MEILVKLIEVDTPDPITGFTYPRGLALEAIDVVEKRIIRNDGILGEELPACEELCEYINPAHASHVVKHMWISGDTVMAKLKLIGKYREMAEVGVEFGGFLRFFQSLEEDNVTVSSMVIITVDLMYREA